MNDRRSFSRLPAAGCILALLAAGVAVSAGPAYRLEILDLRAAFDLLRWAAWGGLGACVVSFAGMITSRRLPIRNGFLPVLLGLILGATVFWLPYQQRELARRLPPIHDITTDTRNPPQFRAVVPLRGRDANSLAYRGDSLAATQRRAYPEIQTMVLQERRGKVFDAVLEAASELGWDIVESSRPEGRLEGVDTTFWFGFRDDIVVRLSVEEETTRVDVRSVSRVGVSDIGKNAERILAFMEAVRSRL